MSRLRPLVDPPDWVIPVLAGIVTALVMILILW